MSLRAEPGTYQPLPSVKQALAKGRPMIASFGDSVATTPVGGHGLAAGARR